MADSLNIRDTVLDDFRLWASFTSRFYHLFGLFDGKEFCVGVNLFQDSFGKHTSTRPVLNCRMNISPIKGINHCSDQIRATGGNRTDMGWLSEEGFQKRKFFAQEGILFV